MRTLVPAGTNISVGFGASPDLDESVWTTSEVSETATFGIVTTAGKSRSAS